MSTCCKRQWKIERCAWREVLTPYNVHYTGSLLDGHTVLTAIPRPMHRISSETTFQSNTKFDVYIRKSNFAIWSCQVARPCSEGLRDAFFDHQAVADVAALSDAPMDRETELKRPAHEIRAEQGSLEVKLLGEALTEGSGRRTVNIEAPLGPNGEEDVRNLLKEAKEENFKCVKPDVAVDILEKWLNEKYLSRRDDHIAKLAAWGPKTVGEAERKFGEVAALMSLSLKSLRAAQVSSKEDFQFEVVRRGLSKDCLVMPPANFASKDIFHLLLQGPCADMGSVLAKHLRAETV